MAMTIGEKIRKLRKELKLTQSQLAGSEMTKSMLSQIENNNASPSMKNLKHIAENLGKPISYFLEDNYQENETTQEGEDNFPYLDEVNKKVKESDTLITKGRTKEAKAILKKLLKDHDFNKNSKLYGDISLKLGACLGYLKEYDKSEEKIKEALEIYEKKQLYIEEAKAYMYLSIRYFTSLNYEESLKVIDNAYKVYEKSLNQDSFFKVEYLYNKAIFLSAMGKIEETMSVLEEAINLSKDTKIYFKSDELYRTRSNLYLLIEKYDEYIHNIEKARQFAEFTENTISQGFIEYSLALYTNDLNKPTEALNHIKKAHKLLGQEFYLERVEKARSYYLLEDYEKAYNSVKGINYSEENVYHTMDFLILWRGKIYEGLILNKLGKSEEAMEAIKKGIEKMETMPPSKFLAFGYKSLSEIHSKQENFEKAFVMLKKATEIEDKLKGMSY